MGKPNIISSLFFLFLFSIATTGRAQFMDLELNIEPDISTSVQKKLAFAQLQINSGTTQILPGDANMGIFNIKGYADQEIIINVQFPDHLTPQNAFIKDIIPVNLEATYNNKGQDDYRKAIPFAAKNTAFQILDQNTAGKTRQTTTLETAYLYVFGSLLIGNIQPGVYEGTVKLTVIYE